MVDGPLGGGIPTFERAGHFRSSMPETGCRPPGISSGWDPANPHLALFTGIVFPEGIQDPYVENWFLGLQHQVRSGIVVEVNYVGTAGHKLFRAEAVNRIPGARLPAGDSASPTTSAASCVAKSTLIPMRTGS